jgi:hypothetical protein
LVYYATTKIIMRFSILTITSAAVAAVGTNAIEAAGKSKFIVSTNENSNEVAANKHSDNPAPAIPHYAPGSFEPTYMPEEDLNPHHVHAGSVASASTTAKANSIPDEPIEDTYEGFKKWMEARLAQDNAEPAASSHVARSVAHSPSAATTALSDAPADGTYEAFAHWMETLYPEELIEEVKQRLHARDAPAPTTSTVPAAAASDTPELGSHDGFKEWITSHFPNGIPEEEEQNHVARSLEEDHEHEEVDWSHYGQEHDLHARSAEDAPETENEFAWGGTFEEFLARQGISPEQLAKEGESTESHAEDPKPQAPVESALQVSEIPASPAVAPTPKPTSVATSTTATSTLCSFSVDWRNGYSLIRLCHQRSSTLCEFPLPFPSPLSTCVGKWYGNCIFCNQLYHKKSQGIFQSSLVAEW